MEGRQQPPDELPDVDEVKKLEDYLRKSKEDEDFEIFSEDGLGAIELDEGETGLSGQVLL